tara:strand:- start:1262 stop:2419 length:1158 start_codon:yes stop_codon:yes gene_type:complete
MSSPKTLIITRDLTPTKIDDLISKLTKDPNVILRLGSQGVKFGEALGLESQLIQLLATWYRAPNSSKTIRTYVGESSSGGFEGLCQSISGMAYLTLCDVAFLEDGKTKASRSEAFRPAISSIQKLASFDFTAAYKGRKIFFPCLKPSKNNGQIAPLYQYGKVSSKDEFKYVMQQCLEGVLGYKEFKQLGNRFFINIGSCVYELFKNTDDHSLKDEDGNYYLKSVRGISVSFNQYAPSDLEKVLSNNPEQYIQFLSKVNRDKANIAFLEISVVDTGGGYAKSWFQNKGKLLDQLSINDEIEAVLKCFEKHRTTKKTKSSGTGLTTVLSCLKDLNAGFILRTGKTVTSWYATDGSEYVEGKNIQVKETALVGTSFSIFIPIIFKDEK